MDQRTQKESRRTQKEVRHRSTIFGMEFDSQRQHIDDYGRTSFNSFTQGDDLMDCASMLKIFQCFTDFISSLKPGVDRVVAQVEADAPHPQPEGD